MALKDIAINIKATGVEQTTQGMKKVEQSAETMGRKVNSVTASSQASYARAEKSLDSVAGATGRVANEIDKVVKSSAAVGGAMHNHASKAYMGMSKLEMGIMGVTMRVMNLTMAAGLIAAPFVAFFAMMKGGISIVDAFAVSVLQIAAQLTQMQAGNGDGIAMTFQKSAAYAEVMAEKLEEIDANSFANNKGLMAMLQTMTMQGAVLDVNNQKQVETFTSLSNAIAMYTAGQDQEIQARQEMRALLTGEVNQHSQLARIMDTQIKAEGIYKGGLKEVVSLGKEHGDTLERFAPYLVGVNAASESINKTWSAVSSSIETAVNKVVREGFQDAFEEVVPLASQLATWLKGSSVASDIIHKVWLAGRGGISAVVDILRGPMWVVLAGVGGLVGKILDGWGLLLSSVLPVLADEFKHLINLLNAMVNMGMAFGLVMLDAVGAVGSAIVSVGKAALQALTGDFEGAGETLKGMFSGVYVERFHENLDVVKGTMVAIREEAAAMRDPIGRMLDNADKYLRKTQQAKGAVAAPLSPPPAPGGDLDELDLEAYEREAQQFRQAYDALYAAHDKAALDDMARATDLQLAALENRHEQGLMSEQQYLDERYRLIAASSDREISQLMQAAQRAQETLDKASADPAYLNRPADGGEADAVDRYNNSVLARVNAEKDLVEAVQKVSEATDRAKMSDLEHAGATNATTLKSVKDQYAAEIALSQALGDTFTATMKQIEADKLGRMTLDEKSRAILAMVDAIKKQVAEYEKLHANDELRDVVAVGATPAYRQQEEAMERSYKRQMELEEAKLALMKQGSNQEAAQIERIQLLEEEHLQWAQKAEEDRWQATAAAASTAMGQIGEVLMQGNRDQFEAGKAMMMGQAIIAAALAIVQAYAQLGPIAGTVAAVGIGIATAAQIATIADTEYEPRAQGGPVVAGGYYLVGEQGPELIRMGSAGTVIPNHALARAGEDQLKATRENTDAIARLSEGFHDIGDSLKDMVLQVTNNGLVANRLAGMGIEKEKSGTMAAMLDAMSVAFTAPIKVLEGVWNLDFKQGIQGLADLLTWGWGGSVFGGEQKITGQGLQLGYSRGRLNAQQYADIKTDGGWFHGDKSRTELSAIDANLARSFQMLSDNIAESIETAGAALGGLALDLSGMTMAATKLDLRGMSEDQANAAIESWFNELAIAMTEQLGGEQAQAELAAATRFGETSYEALMRVTMALQALQEAAITTNGVMLESSIANGDLASSVIEAFGSLDDFASAIDKYNKVVNSGDEYTAIKVAAAHREIAAALADQAVTVPQTVAEYRALVEATDMTSPLYASLIGLADSFETIGDAAREAREGIIDAAREALTKTMDITRSLLAKIRDLQTVDSSLSPEMQYKRASELYASTAVRALAGDQEAAAAIPDLVQQFLNASRAYNASGAGYQADYQNALQLMSRLAGTTGVPTVSESQRLIDEIDKLGEAISDNNLELVDSIGEAIRVGMALAGTNLATGISPSLTGIGQTVGTGITTGLGSAGTNLATGLVTPLAPLGTMDDLRAILAGDQSGPLTIFTSALGAGTAGSATESLANIRINTSAMLQALSAFLEANDVGTPATPPPVRTRTAEWAVAGYRMVSAAEKVPGSATGQVFSPTSEMMQYDVANHQGQLVPDGILDLYDFSALVDMSRGQSPLPQYASGGLYSGGASIMGEYGPELVDSSPGHVYRADETRDLFALAKRGALAADSYSNSDKEVIAALREQNRLLAEMLVEMQKGRRVNQAGLQQIVEQGEEGNKAAAQIVRSKRLAGAR